MKLVLDPMSALRAARIEALNVYYNKLASENAHRDQAYTQKRVWAQTQDARLKPEADLHGLSVADLASLILSKPDTIAERELERQTRMLRVAQAMTPEELNAT